MDHFARPLVRCDGNHTHDFGKRFYERVLVRALKHNEANRTIDRCDEQNRVSHGDVIGGKQRSATRRHVFPPYDVQAVECVRGNPEKKSQQRIR